MNPLPCSYQGLPGHYIGFNKQTRQYKIELLSGHVVETDYLCKFEILEPSEFEELLSRSCITSDPGDEQKSITTTLIGFYKQQDVKINCSTITYIN